LGYIAVDGMRIEKSLIREDLKGSGRSIIEVLSRPSMERLRNLWKNSVIIEGVRQEFKQNNRIKV
jgi:hypothetical protein